jgi:hypothetical protein
MVGVSGALSTRLYFLRLLEWAYVAIDMLALFRLDTSHTFAVISQKSHQRGNHEHVTIAACSYLIARISRRLSATQSGQPKLASCHVSSVTCVLFETKLLLIHNLNQTSASSAPSFSSTSSYQQLLLLSHSRPAYLTPPSQIQPLLLTAHPRQASTERGIPTATP